LSNFFRIGFWRWSDWEPLLGGAGLAATRLGGSGSWSAAAEAEEPTAKRKKREETFSSFAAVLEF